MSCLFRYLSSHSTSIFSKPARFLATRNPSIECLASPSSSSWIRRSVHFSNLRIFDPGSAFVGFRVQCYSSSSSSSPVTKTRSSRSRKSEPKPAMGEEKEAFFVVRKGDIVGVYKTLGECQAQLSPSVCDPPVSVYKGYSLPKDAEDHLLSCGLQNALYTIKASDWKEELFGKLDPCPSQEPLSSKSEALSISLPQKRSHDASGSETVNSCILKFDGASKGNPGKAAAGVVLRANDGNLEFNSEADAQANLAIDLADG